MRLIYCRDIAGLCRLRRHVGRYLLRHGKIAVVLDANRRMEEPVGVYTEARGRKYFKGPQCPRLGDLSDTELVIYGP